jgi:hypothetical protein
MDPGPTRIRKGRLHNDVLTNYAQVSADSVPVNITTQPHTFHFYQMDISLAPTQSPPPTTKQNTPFRTESAIS